MMTWRVMLAVALLLTGAASLMLVLEKHERKARLDMVEARR